MAHRSGFVALIGRPSAGKSTLLNRLLGQKIAIVSPKPQTTRARILGVLTSKTVEKRRQRGVGGQATPQLEPEGGPEEGRPEADHPFSTVYEGYQLALVDTPGLHPRERGLSAALNQVAEQAAKDVDLVALVVDAHARDQNADQELLERVHRARAGRPLALILNKVDLVDKQQLLPMIQRWSALQPFELVYPLSALRGENVEGLPAALADLLPEGPLLFPEEMLTDQTERRLCAELIREQVYRLTRAEVPYSVAVEVETFDESKRGPPKPKVHIDAVLFVARESQKGILIGKRAEKLKAIGSAARREIEKLLGAQVYLGLTVRLESEWTESGSALRRFGYGPQGEL